MWRNWWGGSLLPAFFWRRKKHVRR
ncbi:GlyGly-CTERM sorting domain-containing protein [Lacrimispora sp. AGF001]